MTYQDVLANARKCIGPYCKVCPVCNGVACKNAVPGPGSKGSGLGAVRNYQKWQEICVNMDTICENKSVDTGVTYFGHHLDVPFMAAPVGTMKMHYGDKHDDLSYNSILVPGCRKAGTLAFTGDGTNPVVFDSTCTAIGNCGGHGIPTVKPWDKDTLFTKLDKAKAVDPVAIAMDIDAAGLPFLKNLTPPAGSKTVEELRDFRT